MKNKNPLHIDFIWESNAIEGVYGDEAFEDAMKAWVYALGKKRLDLNTVLHIHELLMKRLNPRIAGKLRTCDVWIGGIRKEYLGEAILSGQLQDVIAFIDGSIVSPIHDSQTKIAQQAHVDFEDVHPFEDGNGRTGRIVYNWHRMKLGLPIHVIHTGAEQDEYYQWF